MPGAIEGLTRVDPVFEAEERHTGEHVREQT